MAPPTSPVAADPQLQFHVADTSCLTWNVIFEALEPFPFQWQKSWTWGTWSWTRSPGRAAQPQAELRRPVNGSHRLHSGRSRGHHGASRHHVPPSTHCPRLPNSQGACSNWRDGSPCEVFGRSLPLLLCFCHHPFWSTYVLQAVGSVFSMVFPISNVFDILDISGLLWYETLISGSLGTCFFESPQNEQSRFHVEQISECLHECSIGKA